MISNAIDSQTTNISIPTDTTKKKSSRSDDATREDQLLETASEGSSEVRYIAAMAVKRLETFHNYTASFFPLLEEYISSSSTGSSNTVSENAMPVTRMFDKLISVCNRALNGDIVDAIKIQMLRTIFNYVTTFLQKTNTTPRQMSRMLYSKYQIFQTMRDKWRYLDERTQSNPDVVLGDVSHTSKEIDSKGGSNVEDLSNLSVLHLTDSSISALYDMIDHAGFVDWREKKMQRDKISNEKKKVTLVLNTVFEMTNCTRTEYLMSEKVAEEIFWPPGLPPLQVNEQRIFEALGGWDDDDDHKFDDSILYSSSDISNDSCESDSCCSYASDNENEMLPPHRNTQRISTGQSGGVSSDPCVITLDAEDVTNDKGENHHETMPPVASKTANLAASLYSENREDNNQSWPNYVSSSSAPSFHPPPTSFTPAIIVPNPLQASAVIGPSVSSFFEPPASPSLEVPSLQMITPHLCPPSHVQEMENVEYLASNEHVHRSSSFVHDARYTENGMHRRGNAVNLIAPSVDDWRPRDGRMDIAMSDPIRYHPSLQVPSVGDLNSPLANLSPHREYMASETAFDGDLSNQYRPSSPRITNPFEVPHLPCMNQSQQYR